MIQCVLKSAVSATRYMTVIPKPSVFTARTQHAHDGFSYSGMWATPVSRLPATQNYDRTIPHKAGSRAK